MPNPFRNRNNGQNCPFPIGTRIRITGGFGRHSYNDRETYTVTTVDCNDRTLQATNAAGEEGNWLRWSDCKRAADIGWDWLRTKLPPEALDLLSAFDGVEQLRLREDLRDRLVLQIPDLHEKILTAVVEQEAMSTP